MSIANTIRASGRALRFLGIVVLAPLKALRWVLRVFEKTSFDPRVNASHISDEMVREAEEARRADIRKR